MSEKYAFWVTLRPQWDCCRQGKAKVRIFNFKTTWSEFQRPSQTAPADVKLMCVYLNNYFDFHVRLSIQFRPSVRPSVCPKTSSISCSLITEYH